MDSTNRKSILIATRGSALALAQANMILTQGQAAFPQYEFSIKIIKTTGDKLQTASMAQEGQNLPKGLFTKELEVALLQNEADLAVHSLKDLPTELPAGLKLGAVTRREDVRDVLLFRDAAYPGRTGRGFAAGLRIKDLPAGAVVATSSTRRKAQLQTQNSGVTAPDIRGNVATRMQKLAGQPGLDGTILALAGMSRLKFKITAEGRIEGEAVPPGLLASVLNLDEMLPCVGQGAIGLEVRENDPDLEAVCRRLNDYHTHQCVTAERAFLAGMGGGCQSPVAAYAQVHGQELVMSALSFASGPVRRATRRRSIDEPVQLGQELATELKSPR